MKLYKYKNVYFCENNIEAVGIIKHISVKFDGYFKDAQLKSLDDVKEKIFIIAQQYDANVITNFKYGQKSNNWFLSLFSLDDIYWYGEGDLVKIDKSIIETQYNISQ